MDMEPPTTDDDGSFIHPALAMMRECLKKVVVHKRMYDDEELEDPYDLDYEKELDDLLWEVFDSVWEGYYEPEWGDERSKHELWDFLYEEHRKS
jgi:hypothetical protein